VTSVDRSMLISALKGLSVTIVALLAVLLSFTAPVVTDTGLATFDVGVPVTGHDIDAPIATVVGSGDGVQTPNVRPAGRPDISQVAFVAGAVAELLFVHLIVPT
jgi:hypothetical protein